MEAHSRSSALFSEALRLIPGGVNSPVRAFRGVGGEPFFLDRAEGPARFTEALGAWVARCNPELTPNEARSISASSASIPAKDKTFIDRPATSQVMVATPSLSRAYRKSGIKGVLVLWGGRGKSSRATHRGPVQSVPSL
jgi:hypothetical protein